MKKKYRTMTRKVNGKVREIRAGEVIMKVSLPMAEIISGAPFVVERMAEELGLMLMMAAIDAEAEKIAGPKHAKNHARKANWWGEQTGYVYYGGKKAPVMKPRIRSKKGAETVLQTYQAFQSSEGATSLCLRDMLRGLSCRNYEGVAERFLGGYGIKKSTVSRRYIKATTARMQELLERDLSDLALCAIFIDGIEFKKEMLIVALGLNNDGKKHVLGLWQGATENTEVCLDLLDDLERRGLDVEKNYLFVLDGSKALRSAVTRKFGTKVQVQRCQLHKRRNVKGYLPPEHQAGIDARLRAAYNMGTYEDAKKSLDLTVKYLERLNPSAARSLKEGLEDTLTVHKLRVGEALRKTLRTTNPIESCLSMVRTVTARIKQWRRGAMRQRWVAVALLEAEGRFRRIRGYREMPGLITSIEKMVQNSQENLTAMRKAA